MGPEGASNRTHKGSGWAHQHLPTEKLFVRLVACLTSRSNDSKRSATTPPRRDIEHCLAHPPTLARQQQVNNLAAS